MESSLKIFRILDAATNRGREAIRVIEDLIRFICDDRSLMELLKSFRHDYAVLTKEIPQKERMFYRDTEFDVGTTVQGKGEYQRTSYIELATANFCRLQESLRSLEEFSKFILPQLSTGMEQLRYRSYILEKKTFAQIMKYLENSSNETSEVESEIENELSVESNFIQSVDKKESGNYFFPKKTDFKRLLLSYSNRPERLKRLFQSSLYVLIDTNYSDEHFLELVDSGVDLIQLRDKTATDREIVERGRELRKLLFWSVNNSKIKNENQENVVPNLPPLLIMNDRPDLAVLANFDGVHVGQDELTIQDVREIVGRDLLVGLSTHSLEQAQKAFQSDIDYIGAGPTFPSQTKKFDIFPGLSFLTELSHFKTTDFKEFESGFQISHFPLKPVFAIGGISLDNLESVLKTGIKRIAVSSVISQATDVKGIVAKFKSFL